IELPLLVDDVEIPRERAGALTRPEEENAAAVEGKMEKRKHLLLSGRLEVNEEVATADEIDAREGCVLDYVVLREHDHLPKIGHDLVRLSDAKEVALETLARHVGQGWLVVHAARRPLQRATMDIGGEDLDLALAELGHQIGKHDGERIRLFAGG